MKFYCSVNRLIALVEGRRFASICFFSVDMCDHLAKSSFSTSIYVIVSCRGQGLYACLRNLHPSYMVRCLSARFWEGPMICASSNATWRSESMLRITVGVFYKFVKPI